MRTRHQIHVHEFIMLKKAIDFDFIFRKHRSTYSSFFHAVTLPCEPIQSDSPVELSPYIDEHR